MSSEYELKMEVAELRNLKADIQQELLQVESLLKQVNASCEALPSDDAVMKEISKAGEELQERWKQLCDTFNTVGSALDGVISNVEAAIARIIENIAGMNKGL